MKDIAEISDFKECLLEEQKKQISDFVNPGVTRSDAHKLLKLRHIVFNAEHNDVANAQCQRNLTPIYTGCDNFQRFVVGWLRIFYFPGSAFDVDV